MARKKTTSIQRKARRFSSMSPSRRKATASRHANRPTRVRKKSTR